MDWSRRHEGAGVVAEGPFQLLRPVPLGKTVLLELLHVHLTLTVVVEGYGGYTHRP